MHERKVLMWNMFVQVRSKWKKSFWERLVKYFAWRNYLRQWTGDNSRGERGMAWQLFEGSLSRIFYTRIFYKLNEYFRLSFLYRQNIVSKFVRFRSCLKHSCFRNLCQLVQQDHFLIFKQKCLCFVVCTFYFARITTFSCVKFFWYR